MLPSVGGDHHGRSSGATVRGPRVVGDRFEQRGAGLAPVEVLGAAGVGGPPGQRLLLRGNGERTAESADRLLPVGQLAQQGAHQLVDRGRRIGAEAAGMSGEFKSIQDKINLIGRKHGCHARGAKDPGAKSGNHISDHISAVSVNRRAGGNLPTVPSAALQGVLR